MSLSLTPPRPPWAETLITRLRNYAATGSVEVRLSADRTSAATSHMRGRGDESSIILLYV